MAHDSNVSPSQRDRPKLTKSRSEVKQLIERQISAGEDLIRSGLSPQWRFLEKIRPWNDYNVELLKSSFTTHDLATEYLGFGSVDWNRYPRVHSEYCVRCLKSILGRIDLFDEPPMDARTTGLPSEASATPIGDLFLVHGKDESAKQAVASPEDPTLKSLWNRVPVKTLWQVIGLAVGIFLFGIAVGHHIRHHAREGPGGN
jgi:hypothetical protein